MSTKKYARKKRKSTHRLILRAPYTPSTVTLKSFETYRLRKRNFRMISI